MDQQPEVLDKLALCLSSCRLAKEVAVRELGIGEDLPFTLFGWVKDDLKVIAQLHPHLMREEHESRLGRVGFCAAVLRQAWGVDAITFMAEAYSSTDPERTRGHELAKLFTEKDSGVSECLTFTHIAMDSVSLVMLPYRQELGRKVVWMEPAFQDEATGLRDAAYPGLIADMLGLDVGERPDDVDLFLENVADKMVGQGFSVQYF